MVDIVIVNWNAGDQLRDVIESVWKYNIGIVQSIVVVDNASSDHSLDFITANKSMPIHVSLIRNTENKGFGFACNQGARECSSEYILFLNPDAKLFDDTISKAVQFMSDPKNSDVGVCGAQLIDEHNQIARSCARFPNPLSFVLHSVGLLNLNLFATKGMHMLDWDHTETRSVDHVIGAFYFMRKHIFNALKGFDERFFVYLEDLDLSLRTRQAGFSIVYLTEVKAFHVGGGTSNQVKSTRLFYALRSRILYAFKHFNLLGAFNVLFFTLFVELFVRSIQGVIKGSFKRVLETWRGYFKLLGWIVVWMFSKSHPHH